MARAIVVLLVVIILAGCAGPGGQGDEPTPEPDAPNGTTTDNDYGAEPVNPPNGTATEDRVETTGGEATANGTGTGNGS